MNTQSGMEKCMQTGKASIAFDRPPGIICSASVAGPKEGEGPLGQLFDEVDADGTCGQGSWEQAESCLQKKAVERLLKKASVSINSIRYILAGDLLGQSIASSFGLKDMPVPFIGMYGACSTMGLTLGMGAVLADGGYADYTVCVTSSHYGAAERQFRFPSDYGNQRPLCAEWTVTGAGAVLIGAESKAKEKMAVITGITTGQIVDYGIKDSMNMGAAMAPAAADTIFRHMKDFSVRPEYYDKIITGDLGKTGSRILCDLLKDKGMNIEERHMDCGIEIFDDRKQDTHSGGSGCGCSAAVLAAYILPLLKRKQWKRILFVPTGALLSKVSFNEGQSIPGIAHGVVLESR